MFYQSQRLQLCSELPYEHRQFFGDISECFNAPIVVNQSRKLGCTSFPEYCAVVKRKKAGQGEAFAAKLSWNQLFFLRRIGMLDSIFADPRYVLVRRRDLVAQAVSKSIAVQTRRFKSSHPDKGIEPKYDFRDIAATIRSITTSNGIFMEFFAVTGTPYFEIVYEDFVADPAAHTDRLCRWLSLPVTTMDDEKINLRVQRNGNQRSFSAPVCGRHESGHRRHRRGAECGTFCRPG